MHEVHMARIAFGIKRPLNDERAFVMALDETRTSAHIGARRVPVC
jgi:hypothetical protein